MMRIMGWWIFLVVGFYICGVLTIIPLSVDYQWYRPQWFLMFVIFCQVIHPASFNPILAWIGGLLVDALLGTPLGEHALVFAIICYLTALLRAQFMMRPLWQQWGKVFLLVCLGQILILLFHLFTGQNPRTLLYWLGSITSCLSWPLFELLFQHIRKIFNVCGFSSRTI